MDERGEAGGGGELTLIGASESGEEEEEGGNEFLHGAIDDVNLARTVLLQQGAQTQHTQLPVVQTKQQHHPKSGLLLKTFFSIFNIKKYQRIIESIIATIQ